MQPGKREPKATCFFGAFFVIAVAEANGHRRLSMAGLNWAMASRFNANRPELSPAYTERWDEFKAQAASAIMEDRRSPIASPDDNSRRITH